MPRLAEAGGSLRHDLAPKEASREPTGRSLSRLTFDIGKNQAPEFAVNKAAHFAIDTLKASQYVSK